MSRVVGESPREFKERMRRSKLDEKGIARGDKEEQRRRKRVAASMFAAAIACGCAMASPGAATSTPEARGSGANTQEMPTHETLAASPVYNITTGDNSPVTIGAVAARREGTSWLDSAGGQQTSASADAAARGGDSNAATVSPTLTVPMP